MGASGRRAAGCQRGGRAGVDGRPAHVRPGRVGPDGAAGRGGRRVGADRGADGGAVRLAGPDLRVRRKPPAPRSPLVLVQLPDLAAAGLVRREGAFTRRTGRIVLQRPADRAEAGWAGRAVVAAFAGECEVTAGEGGPDPGGGVQRSVGHVAPGEPDHHEPGLFESFLAQLLGAQHAGFGVLAEAVRLPDGPMVGPAEVDPTDASALVADPALA